MYKITVPQAGSLSFVIETRNEEANRDGYFTFRADVKDLVGYDVEGFATPESDWMPPLYEIKRDTIHIYGWRPGQYYLNLGAWSYDEDSGEEVPWHVSYRIKFFITDSTINNDAEPNNSVATAIPVAIGDTIRGNINFVQNPRNYWGIDEDYYKLDIPEAGKLVVHSKIRYWAGEETYTSGYNVFKLSMAGSNMGRINLDLPKYSDNIIYPDSVYISHDTSSCNVLPGDAFLSLYSNAYDRYDYEIWVEVIPDPSYITSWGDDPEPNTERNQAVLLTGGQAMEGRIGYYEPYSAGSYNDYYDYYKIKFPVQD